MSISQNPLFSSLRKSMANFTTYTLHGQNIVRSKAFNPKDAKTVAQLVHRAGFKLIVETFQSFGQYTELGFVERKGNYSVYNAFMAANLSNAIDKTGLEPVLDYSKLLIASGSLPKVSVKSGKVDASGIAVCFNTNIGLPKVSAMDDIVLLVLYKNGGMQLVREIRGNDAESSIQLLVKDVKATDLKCCYLFALSADGKKASNSTYVEVNP